MNDTRRNVTYSHILKYTGLFGGVQVITILVGIVRNKIVALLLGPSGMGLLSLFNSTTKMLSEASNLGIPTGAVPELSLPYDNNDQKEFLHRVTMVRSWSLICAIAGMMICVGMASWLEEWNFGWGRHTWHYVFLSPVIALTAITGGEMAILKSTRQLGAMARVSVINVLLALLVSVPLYFFMGERGIVPSLVLMALVLLLLTIRYSWRLVPLRLSFNKKCLGQGTAMIKLGIGVVIAGLLGNCAEFIVRSFISHHGSLDEVGLYNAAFMITVTYGGMVFAAMETDYFPRLSGISEPGAAMNQTVNQQMEVSTLVVSPLLVALIVFAPILIPLMYSGKFMAVIGMVQVMVLGLYFRALTLPLSYIPLSRSHSLFYIFVEGFYAVALVVCTIIGHNLYGLYGVGMAITIVSVVEFLFLIVCMRWRYGYRLGKMVMTYMAIHLPVGLAAFAITLQDNCWLSYGIGLLLIIASTAFSLLTLKKKTKSPKQS